MFNRKELTDTASQYRDSMMETRYSHELALLKAAARDGAFSLIFVEEEIKPEFISWLLLKDFTIYVDAGEYDGWLELGSFDELQHAVRVKVSWEC